MQTKVTEHNKNKVDSSNYATPLTLDITESFIARRIIVLRIIILNIIVIEQFILVHNR